MADIQSNIGINIDASGALAQLKALQRQISVFNSEIAKGGAATASAAANMQRELVNGINATGQFSASMRTVRTTTESFTNSLEKNKFSMGEYFRYAGASTKKFGHLFTNELNTIEKVARERVKTIQTQYVKMGRDTGGALKAIAIRPLTLDMNNLATQTAMAAQKQQIFNQLMRQGSTNILNWGKNTQWAGRQLMVGFTIPLTIFGAAAASSFMKLEEQAIRFRRVYGELFTPPGEADMMLDQIKELALEFTKYGVAVEKTMELASEAAAMGQTGSALTAQVSEAGRLAVLGAVEQSQALETTISLTNAFGIATEDLASKIDFLNAVENQTVVSIEDLTIAIPKAGPVVKQLGGDVEDLAFFLTAMKEGGINASEGANALKSGLAALINPTGKAKEMLAGFGINIEGMVRANKGDVSGLIVEFARALDGLDPLNRAQAIEQLFGKFQFSRISTLFQNVIKEGTQASRVLELSSATVKELADLSQSELGRLEESPLYKFQGAIAEFQAALAPIGEAFLKLVTPIVEFGSKVLNAFNNLNDGAKAFIVGLVATLGAVAPVLIMGVGLLANGFANFLKVLLGVQSMFQRLRGGASALGQQTEYMTQEQLEAASIASSLNQSHATLAQTFTSEASAVARLTQEYQKMVAAQRASLGIPMTRVATSAPGFMKGRKVPGYKDGVVMVPGPKGAGDVQPAMLAPGEAVIPAKMAERYGPLINEMIAGNIPGYVDGLTTPLTSANAVASHSAGLDPRSFANTIKELADAGYVFKGTVRRLTEDADGLGVTIDLLSGNLHELVQDTDNVFASGKSFAGTAMIGTEQRNEMLNKTGIGGEWLDVDELFRQEQVLLQHKKENSLAYQNHTVEIEALIQEAQLARTAISQSTDQERAKLEINKQRAKQVLALSLMSEKGLTQEQAEIEAGKRVAEADKVYAQEIQNGVSSEQALNKARLFLIKQMLEAGSMIFSAADQSLGTEWPRQDATSSGSPSRSRQRTAAIEAGLPRARVTRNFGKSDMPTGTANPPTRPTAKAIVAQLSPTEISEMNNLGEQAIRTLIDSFNDGARRATKQASPSKVALEVGANVGRSTIQGVESQIDEAKTAGQALAQSATSGFNNFPAEGSQPGTRGGRGRVRTAGPTTPGQPLAFDIVGGQQVQAVQRQLSISSRIANANLGSLAASAVNGANKIGAFGVGLSSLAGGLSMIKGPLGELSSKIFPVISAITGLAFAMNFLRAEDVKAGVEKRQQAVKEIISNEKVLKSEQLEQISKQKNSKITDIESNARKRGVTVTNTATAAMGRFSTALNAAMLRLGVSAAIGPQGALLGTPLQGAGAAAGGAVARGAGGVAAAGAAVAGVTRTVVAPVAMGAAKAGGALAKAGAGLGAIFSKVGAVLGSVVRSIGGVLGAIIGVSGPVALVVAGLAAFAGGLYLLVKVVNEQRAKVQGLGDAANLSSKKLDTLNSILGTTLSLPWTGGVGGTGAGATGLQATTQEGAAQAQSIQQQLTESKEFQKEYKGIISAVGEASDLAATQALTSLAITLKTAGAEEEMVAGIVNAILQEAGREDVSLDFESISIKNAVPNAKAAADEFVRLMEENAREFRYDPQTNRYETGPEGTMGARQANAATAMGADTAQQLDLAASSLSSAVLGLNAQFNSGAIDVATYNSEMQGLGDIITDIGTNNLQSAIVLASTLAAELSKIPNLSDLSAQVAPLLASGTQVGLAGATAITQARSSGVDLTGQEANIDAITLGATSTDPTEIANAVAATKAIQDLTEARREEQAVAAAGANADAFVDQLDAQNEALKTQTDTFNQVSNEIKNNNKIVDKGAFAQKIATDETLRNEWATAQLAGTTDAFIDKLIEQEALQTAIDYDAAIAALQSEVQAKEESALQTEALTLALGDAELAQVAMGDAAVATAIAALYAQETLNGAVISAEDFAKKVKESGIIELIQSLPSIGTGGPGGGRGGGGGAAPQLDSIVKKLRDVTSATVSLKKGWAGMQQVIQNLFQGGTTPINIFDGLSNQLRSVGLGENMIEYIVGMDPDEFEKRKKELFVYKDGNIVGVTAKLKNLQAAFNAIAMGEYVNTQQKSISNIKDQIDAIKILTANGLTYAESLQVVQDQEIATAIAKGATQEQIRKTIEVTRELMKLRGQMEAEDQKSKASEAVRKTNEEFKKREKVLQKLASTAGQYSDEQITAILNDSNLQDLFLNPKIDKKAFNQAMANAQKAAEIELRIRLSTVEGMKSVVDEGITKAMEALGAQEQQIELSFQADIANDEKIIREAENAISEIQFEIDDLQAELQRIERQEEEINKAYDKRVRALDDVAKANERIAAAQRSQLDIADALSKGDIAGAARAIQEARERRAKDAAQAQREQLERARENQISRLTGRLGLTREQLEQQIRDLENQVFDLEEEFLEPAQERIRLAQELRDEQIRSLEVLGKTRQEWDEIRNNVDIAQTNSWKFVDAIQTALENVQKLMTELGAPQGQGSGIAGTNASSGGLINMNDGGVVGSRRMAMGGRVKGYPMGGLIPYKSVGGFFKSLGSDTVPAMLTPGEFVIRRPAVRDFGVKNLDSINRGTYSSGSVYNYNLNVNVRSEADANDIARTVVAQIKRVDSQRIRGNRF